MRTGKQKVVFPYYNRIKAYAKHHASLARKENIIAEELARRPT